MVVVLTLGCFQTTSFVHSVFLFLLVPVVIYKSESYCVLRCKSRTCTFFSSLTSHWKGRSEKFSFLLFAFLTFTRTINLVTFPSRISPRLLRSWLYFSKERTVDFLISCISERLAFGTVLCYNIFFFSYAVEPFFPRIFPAYRRKKKILLLKSSPRYNLFFFLFKSFGTLIFVPPLSRARDVSLWVCIHRCCLEHSAHCQSPVGPRVGLEKRQLTLPFKKKCIFFTHSL